MIPHNMTMTVTGTAMLWVGWYGFNGGSALAANGQRAYFQIRHRKADMFVIEPQAVEAALDTDNLQQIMMHHTSDSGRQDQFIPL